MLNHTALNNTMFVIKRDGRREELSLDKITRRIRKLAHDPYHLDRVNIMEITLNVISNIVNDITTTELDNIAAWICSSRSTEDDQYESLAVRLSIGNIHKNTCNKFSDMIEMLKVSSSTLINDTIYNIICENKDTIDNMIVNDRDYLFSYFGVKTLEKMYLLIQNGVVVERPQYMWMRTALEIHKNDMQMVEQTYTLMSQHYFTHATPTLFNAGLKKNQLSSCMLLTNQSDSIEGIYETLKQCSILGACSAGLGLSMTNIRASGSIIKSTGRPSRGIPSFLMVHDINATVVDQGGKRKMSSAIYLEPWHADFLDVLDMKANDNTSPMRARELFYAVWSNNLLYERAMNSGIWSFFCPTNAPLLLSTSGEEFKTAYEQYEAKHVYKHQIPARDLYLKIAVSMNETGGPYHLNKDACIAKSNMKNVAHLNSSNLCAEILIPSGLIDGNYEIGVCTLASINLAKFVTESAIYDISGNIANIPMYDFDKLASVAGVICQNLNNVIDTQYYPVEGGRISSMRHRPIGVGVQGLADVFMRMGYPYESIQAKELNWQITEAIYYGAIMKSMEIAQRDGSYKTFKGSPASMGKLQPHLWVDYGAIPLPYRYDWDAIGKQVMCNGLRNALLVAYMPTASTSQLLGNFSSFEPCTANIFSRHTFAGTFTILNKHLVNDLKQLNIWSKQLKDKIISHNGSVQYIDEIPQHLKLVYKTVWEMSQKTLLEMSADRGQFICHTQSLNIFMEEPTLSKTTSLLMYGMKLGLKTISYYTRSRPAIDPIKFSISADAERTGKSRVKSAIASAVSASTANAADTTPTLTADINAPDKKRTIVCTDDVCTSCSS